MLRVTQLAGFGVAGSSLTGHALAAGAGSYSLAGTAATLTKAAAPGSFLLMAGAATYSLTGTVATPRKAVPGTEAAAFLARTSGLNMAHTDAYAALINGLVADGVWSKLDMLHVYATQDSTTALLNLVSSSFAGTAHGSPTFTADRGFTGVESSTTVYIETGFFPTIGGQHFTNTSGHISAWSVSNVGTSGKPIMGAIGFSAVSETVIYPKFTDNKEYFRVGGGGVAGTTVTNIVGHYIASRISSSSVDGYKNGAFVSNTAGTGPVAESEQYFTLGWNFRNTPGGSGCQVGMASIGAGLSSTESGNFYSRLRTYMTAVGVP